MRRLIVLLSLVLAAAASAPAAIVLIQKATDNNAGGTPSATVTLGATPSVGNTIVVGIVSDSGNCGVESLLDNQAGNGNVYSRVLFAHDVCGNATNEASVWCAPVQFASGTFTITASQQLNSFITLFAVEYSGLSCNGDQVSFGVNASSPYTCGTYTTTNANDLLIAILSLNSASTAAATPPAGYTTQLSQTNPSFEIGFYADQIVSSTGAQTPSWTSATTPFGSIPCTAVALKQASGGGGGGAPFGYPR